MQHAMVLEGVRKQFQEHTAVKDMDLAIPTGTIYGILGPNGAGKSTTLRMALNIIACDSGKAIVLGKNPVQDRDVLRRVGYLPEERGLYRRMTVIDAIYAKAGFGATTMGPPGHVHGGAMAATLDEAMGAVCWMNGHKVVAATITINFLSMLPIETETIVEARLARQFSVRGT